jgi:hypothetical protein
MEDMTWNFRLVDMTAVNDGEHWIEVKEVFYEEEKPVGYTSATVGGESAADIKKDLLRMLIACNNPILKVDADDKFIDDRTKGE